MKAAPFEYLSAKSIDEAVQALEAGGGDAIIIAGGQSLMPMLVMRMARPDTVIDINDIKELDGIGENADEVVIKSCTRQAEALQSPIIARRVPLLAKAISHVGHQQTRNRGTIGGSLLHSDPASEIPLAARTLDAYVTLISTQGSRTVTMDNYFQGPLMTARKDNELLVSIHFPEPGPDQPGKFRRGSGFQEISERRGDFAMVSAAALIHLDERHQCRRAAIGLGGVDGKPVRIPGLEERLLGKEINSETLAPALPEILTAINPGDDHHASADYRRRVALVLAERAILEAVAEAMATPL